MPVYDYHCRACGEDFSRREKISEHHADAGDCPKCGSRDVERVLSAAYPRTARKS